MKASELISAVKNGALDNTLSELYGSKKIEKSRDRYISACKNFISLYGDDGDVRLFSSPGRTEVLGNHTDHNCGKVVAGAVDLDVIAVVTATNDKIIKVKSEGYPEDVIDIENDEYPSTESYYTSKALIAGISNAISKKHFNVGGFRAYTTSNVQKGSGLSSSAAFEVLIGEIINQIYCEGKLNSIEIAKIAQYAENNYFGKPCGLMDQTACAVGGLVYIDFMIPDSPEVSSLDFDLSKFGYSLAIVATGGNHADLNDDYAAVPAEMKEIAKYFGEDTLRDVAPSSVIEAIKELRQYSSDRAILRALHFFNENERVDILRQAAQEGDIQTYLDAVRSSGASSMDLLQNVYTPKNPGEQPITLALELSDIYTNDSAFRVHGGGFAGTIQIYLKEEEYEEYRKKMDTVFGSGSCRKLSFRKYGAIEIKY